MISSDQSIVKQPGALLQAWKHKGLKPNTPSISAQQGAVCPGPGCIFRFHKPANFLHQNSKRSNLILLNRFTNDHTVKMRPCPPELLSSPSTLCINSYEPELYYKPDTSLHINHIIEASSSLGFHLI